MTACYHFRGARPNEYAVFDGVADGARTHDNRNHNLMHLFNTGAACSPIRGNDCPPNKHGRMRVCRGWLPAIVVLCLSLPAMAGQRSAAEVLAFKRAVPCPATGLRYGSCPGWEIDHVHPICVQGSDTRENMQWLTIQEHRWKTRTDVRVCRQLRKESAKQRSE